MENLSNKGHMEMIFVLSVLCNCGIERSSYHLNRIYKLAQFSKLIRMNMSIDTYAVRGEKR
jgi:hypothetical protein